MKEKLLGERYGEAFLSYAKDTIGFEKAAEELRNLKLFLHQNAEFFDFLKEPQIVYEAKCDVIDKVLGKDFTEETRDFLKLLAEKRRIRYIDNICDYVRTTSAHGEAEDVLLKTTYPLENDMVQKIKNKIEEKFGRKMNFFIQFDPDLMGGIQVIVGNTIIDGSVRNRIMDLRTKLMKIRIDTGKSF